MPNLLSILDSEALENRYIDKFVVYVEGDDDEKVWTKVVGNDCRDRIEFRVPAQGGCGFEIVIARVQKERPQNPKVFGLVDGEAVASRGCVDLLLLCQDSLFSCENPDLDGILFISDHELENLLLRHSKLSHFIAHDVAIREFGTRSEEYIENAILSLARRYFLAALFKYVSAEFKHRNCSCVLLDVQRFRSEASTLQVITELRKLLDAQPSIDRAEFMNRLFEISGQVRLKVRQEGSSSQSKLQNLIRLADGKKLMVAIQVLFKIKNNWQGHLIGQFLLSAYAQNFREELFKCLAPET